MKRVLLFGGAFVTGLAAALLAAAAMVVLPGWLQRESWQAQRPAEVVPTAAPAAGEEESAPAPRRRPGISPTCWPATPTWWAGSPSAARRWISR